MTAIGRWLALSVLLAAAFGARNAAAATDDKIGVSSAVNPEASGTAPGGEVRRLVLGQDVVYNERIATGPAGQTQILFVDESALTVAPNSDMTIDNFVYDPNTGGGRLAMSATVGVLRFVGGKLSKNENAVTVQTPTGTLGIRGGIFVMNLTRSGEMQVIFLFGKGLSVTGACPAQVPGCVTQTITRPGYMVTIAGRGAAPSSPTAAPSGSLATMLAQLSGRSGASAGATTVPTDASVAYSGIANVISSNVAASVQQAAQNSSATGQAAVLPSNSTRGALQTQNNQGVAAGSNLSSASSQSDPVIVNAQQNPTPPGTPIKSSTPPNNNPNNNTGTINIGGVIKATNGPATQFGFDDQTGAGRVPYAGTITFPPGQGLANGVATTTINGVTYTLSPLTAGEVNGFVTATSTNAGAATGTATYTADGDFFFANLVNAAGERIFVSGGVPVSQTFYAPTPTNQILALNVMPDAALGTSTSAQTVPFLPSFAGGTFANAVVSPLYIVTPPNTQFGTFNFNNPNSGIVTPKWLQTSLAVSGQGMDQKAAIELALGTFATSSTGSVETSGPLRGIVLNGGTSPIQSVTSGIASVADANGNALYGGTTLDGLVLDQNQYNSGNFSLNQANADTYQNINGSGVLSSTQYGFNQPVVATTLPAGVGTNRSMLVETGWFGGIMNCCNANVHYAMVGPMALVTDPVSSELAATFVGLDPNTGAGSHSGLGTLELNFGSLPNQGLGRARSTFIDNNIFAAQESPITPDVIQATVAGSGNTQQTVTFPTYDSLGPNNGLVPATAMVTAAALGANANSWMPAGVTPCACQYLQWGYWTARLETPNSTLTGAVRVDVSSINTWIAGQPTTNMPTMGTASYNGAAVGTVYNNGANYLAAGNFNQTYNFGSQTGTVTIANFDGATYHGNVTGSGVTFSAPLTGPNRTGSVLGNFYGPNAVETGGVFNIRSSSGLNYLASGIFAGR